MKNSMTKGLFVALVAIVVLGISGCNTGSGGGGGGGPTFVPEITGFSLDVATINVGTSQQATMTISVTPGTTVTSVDYQAVPISGSIPNAGFWVYNAPVTNNQFTISPNQYVPDATWSVSQMKVKTANYIYNYLGSGTTYGIEVTDLAGVHAGDLKNNATTIVVAELATSGGIPDNSFPYITSVSVTPSSHTFIPGDTVTLTIGVSDTGSGIGIIRKADLSPAYVGSSGPFQEVQLNIVNPNTLEGQLVLSSSMDAYPLNLSFYYIAVSDAAGNLTYLNLDPAYGANYIDNSAQATIAAISGSVPFAFTPFLSRTVANGVGWAAPDSSLGGFHTVTAVSASTVIDVFTITGNPTALHFQADTGSPYAPNSSTPGGGSAYSAKWPTFSFFWEDGTVAQGGLEPASTPTALPGIASGYYNPGIRITSVGSHTKLYVFCYTASGNAGILMERVY